MPASSYPGGQPPSSSGTSTPALIPQTEEERMEREHQKEADLQLAASMSRGLEAIARSRSRSGGKEIQADDMGETYRTLRDAQAEQDAHFFEASASPTNRQTLAKAGRNPPSPPTAAARLYRQNRRRTLSDTSVDSQAGFIDHRGSQASMSRNSARSERHQSPREMVKSAAKNKSSRLRAEVQPDSARRRATSVEDGSGEDDAEREEEDMHQSSTSPSNNIKSRTRKGTYESAISASKPGTSHGNSSMRRSSYELPDDEFDEAGLEGSALANEGMDEEPGVVDHRGHGSQSRRSPIPRDFLHRTDSRRSNRSSHSHHSHEKRSELDEDPTFTPSLSRRPSDVNKVEEDVCYPMLQLRDAEMDEERGGSPPRHHRGSDLRSSSHRRDSMGIPGVLPNFPFPFDFGALEEHCDEEREKHGVAIPKAKKGSIGGTAVASGSSGTRAISFSPDNPDGGGMMRRRMNGEVPARRQRKLSESVGGGVGRYQRKLAIFEGSGQRGDDKTVPADVKTPLLAEGGKARPGFGATAFASHRSNTSGAEKARPYRFSFYSNALSSTIHARSLAEIPAENQSFEDLFVGRRESPAPEEWEGSTAGQAEGANGTDSNGRKPGSTGHSTPNHQNTAPSLASYKTVGGMGGMMSRVPNYEQKPRTNVIRSVEDAEANTWWLDVLCPTDAEMKVLGKVFGIHPLTIEDILMEETREKIELFRNYYFVCFRSFDQDPYSPTYLEPLNMYIIVFREGTLSFHFRGTPHPQNVRRRIKQLKDFINVTSDWISYALIDDITDAFGPLIQNIEYEVDSIDELVLILKDAEQSDMLRRIGTCRKKVMGLLRLMGNKADVVKGLAKRCNENWSVAPKSDIGLYLSDIQDHLITMTQNLNHYEKILSRSHSNYLAQISIEMTDANNQINDVLSKLTALGTVLIPMNLVTGLWGMNVHVPGQDVENLHWFFAIVGFLLAFAIAGGYLTYRAFSK